MLTLETTALPREDEAFRTEVRSFLAVELTDEFREPAKASATFLTSFAERDIALKWQAKLLETLARAEVTGRIRRPWLVTASTLHLRD